MAITSIEKAVFGQKAPIHWHKKGATMEAAGVVYSTAYVAGVPGAATAPSPGMSGEALTAWTGQLPYTNATGSNEIRITRFGGSPYASGQAGQLYLYDRLWQNSGIDVTSSSPQSLGTPVAIPARDEDGTTAGRLVRAAFEVSTATGSAAVRTGTITYTNSAGTGSRTGTCSIPGTAAVGTFVEFTLQAGDVGVRSIESFQLNNTMASGAVHLVLFRELARANSVVTGVGAYSSARLTGMPKCYDNTVPFVCYRPGVTTLTDFAMGQLIYTEG